jgi:hypothetical protein
MSALMRLALNGYGNGMFLSLSPRWDHIQAVFSVFECFSNLSFSFRSIARFCDAVYGGELPLSIFFELKDERKCFLVHI